MPQSVPRIVQQLEAAIWAHLPSDVAVRCEPAFVGDNLAGFIVWVARELSIGLTFGLNFDDGPYENLLEDAAVWAAEALGVLNRVERG